MAKKTPTPTVEEIEAAYKIVLEDKSFRSSEPKNTETKLFLVQAYERLTGKRLLTQAGKEGEGYGMATDSKSFWMVKRLTPWENLQLAGMPYALSVDPSFGFGFTPVFASYEEALKYANGAEILPLTRAGKGQTDG